MSLLIGEIQRFPCLAFTGLGQIARGPTPLRLELRYLLTAKQLVSDNPSHKPNDACPPSRGPPANWPNKDMSLRNAGEVYTSRLKYIPIHSPLPEIRPKYLPNVLSSGASTLHLSLRH